MFLDRLSAAEQAAFFSVARHLIAADGVIDPAEQALLQQLRATTSLGPDWEPDTTTAPGALLAQLSSPASRRAAMLELLGVAHADTVYSEPERRFIHDAAAAMGISAAEVALLEGWVARQLDLAAEAERLLRGN